MPETQDRYNKMGIDPRYDTPEQFAAWLDRESAQWAKVIREAGIKPD
jgi:tripartite-type tricarboxylate transporter receptor subunit TctC